MQTRFAHQMEIEKLDFALQFVCQLFKLFATHNGFRSLGFGAERAVQVANIRYFQITALNHFSDKWMENKFRKDTESFRFTRPCTLFYPNLLIYGEKVRISCLAKPYHCQ